MATYPYYLVDAFTTAALGGNPCAVVLDADALDDATMQAIAREMNLSETAFVRHAARADFAARYFTPTLEVPLAGHPTIATTMALIAAQRLRLASAETTMTLELRAGIITVIIQRSAQGQPVITMAQPAPTFMRIYAPTEVLPLFDLEPADLLPGLPIQTVSTGTPQLMVPLRDLDALRRVNLHGAAYQAFKAQSDFFSPHFFCLHGATAAGQTFARHFVPPGSSEDPATGSATGGMAAYLWHYRVIDTPRFVAEQGHWMQRPSTMQAAVTGPPDDITAVHIGGTAVVVIQGAMTLPDANPRDSTDKS